MNNLGSTLAKIMVFAGGAFAGALLTEWLDKLVASRAEEQLEYDKSHYAQGLKPHSHPASDQDYQKSE
jgi:hypothetical protein